MTIYSDGAARGNPGPAGIGVVVRGASGAVLAELAEGIGVATNNVAEYRAALAGLSKALDLGARTVLLRSDSRLLIEQLEGRYRIKNPTLAVLHGRIRGLLPSFADVRFEHVPRELNAEADRLANRGIAEWLAGPGRGYRRPEPPATLFRDDG